MTLCLSGSVQILVKLISITKGVMVLCCADGLLLSQISYKTQKEVGYFSLDLQSSLVISTKNSPYY